MYKENGKYTASWLVRGQLYLRDMRSSGNLHSVDS
jgi:hypothetical protein